VAKRVAKRSDVPRGPHGPEGIHGRARKGPWSVVEREPARKHQAREIGHGSSGRESSEGRLQWARAAWNKAAKRRGVTANGGLREETVRAASAARTVERGKNPEDGTGEGVAALTRHGAILVARRGIVAWSNGAPGVRRSREQEPQERRSRLCRSWISRVSGPAIRKTGSRDAVRL